MFLAETKNILFLCNHHLMIRKTYLRNVSTQNTILLKEMYSFSNPKNQIVLNFVKKTLLGLAVGLVVGSGVTGTTNDQLFVKHL